MILIIGERADPHIQAVCWGLSKKGQRFSVWTPALGSQGLSIELQGPPNGQLKFINHGESFTTAEIKCIWYRRSGVLSAPNMLSEEQARIYKKEWKAVREVVFGALSDTKALKVNDPNCARRAENKLLQLIEAKSVGFEIPKTLIGNSPESIREFYSICNRDIIHKMFRPFQDRAFVAATASVPEALLENSLSLSLTPGIYQERITTAYELRVTAFGSTVIAGKIRNAKSKFLDAKLAVATEQRIEVFEVPHDLQELCLQLLAKLNLSFATMDIGRLDDGSWVVFDINQSGNFLWLESLAPRITMLDAFCEFLVSGESSYQYKQSGDQLRLQDFNSLLPPRKQDDARQPLKEVPAT